MNSNEVKLDEIINSAKEIITECQNSLCVKGIDTVVDTLNMLVNSYGENVPAHKVDELHALIHRAKNTIYDVYTSAVETIKEKQCWELIPDVMEMHGFDDGQLKLTIPGESSDGNWTRKAFFELYDMIPLDRLYRTTLRVYMADGFNFPYEPIVALTELRPDSYLEHFPEEYKEEEEITIYRASTTLPEEIDRVSHEYSWTIDPNIAMCYYRTRTEGNRMACTIYSARILKNDIIAYVSPDSECEVIQYDSVYDVKPISPDVLDSIRRLSSAILHTETKKQGNNPHSGINLCNKLDQYFGRRTSTFVEQMADLAKATRELRHMDEIAARPLWLRAWQQ